MKYSKVVYVAGPFRGPNHWAIHKNIRRAEEIAFDIWRVGAVALCPHLNTIHFQDALPDDAWLTGDLELLRRCDAVVMVPGWEYSQGAQAERKYAKEHNIPVIDGSVSGSVVDDFTDWLKDTRYQELVDESKKRTGL